MIVCRECGQQNNDGRVFCANFSCGAFLEWRGTKADAEGPGSTGDDLAARPPSAEASGSATKPTIAFTASVSPLQASVEPGQKAILELRVTNTGTIVDQYLVEPPAGDAGGWAAIDPPALSLFPRAEGMARITLSPPRAATTRSGAHILNVVVVSGAQTSIRETVGVVLTVGSYSELSAQLVPRTSVGRFSTRHRLSVANAGNAGQTLTLHGDDPDGSLRFEFAPPSVGVGPGREETAHVRVRPQSRHWRGADRAHPFRIRLRAPDADEDAAAIDGTMDHRALLPRPLLPVLAAVAALAVGGAVLNAVALSHGPSVATSSSSSALVSPSATASPASTPTATSPSSPSSSVGGGGGAGCIAACTTSPPVRSAQPSSASAAPSSRTTAPTTQPVPVTYLYWADDTSYSIARAATDGSGVNQSFIPLGVPVPVSVAVDSQHIYWATLNADTIGRANRDGTGVNQSFITGVNNPQSMTIDANHIYWTNSNTGSIGRANLDGSAVTQSFITGLSFPDAIAVDRQHIYFATAGGGVLGISSIGRANLDGTSVTQSFIATGGVVGLAVNAQYIFWSVSNKSATGTTLGRANIDGSQATATFITGAGNPSGPALDGQHIYWTNYNSGTIGRANLDGSGVNESFITGLATPVDPAVG